MKCILTQEELEACCREWQEILALQPWEFQIMIKRAYDMNPDHQASINWVVEKQMAIISFLDPGDYDPAFMGFYDVEVSLVHELLHARLAGVSNHSTGDGSFGSIAEEQAVHHLANALVKLKRERDAKT